MNVAKNKFVVCMADVGFFNFQNINRFSVFLQQQKKTKNRLMHWQLVIIMENLIERVNIFQAINRVIAAPVAQVSTILQLLRRIRIVRSPIAATSYIIWVKLVKIVPQLTTNKMAAALINSFVVSFFFTKIKTFGTFLLYYIFSWSWCPNNTKY